MVSLPSAFRLLPIPAFVKEKPQAAIKRRAQRGRISAKRRFQVLRKCGFRCVYCELPITEEDFTVDHVIPRTKGGSNDFDNLVAACNSCNAKKGARPLEVICG